MNPVSEDIKDMLVDDSSLGLTFKEELFIGREPDKEGNFVTIIDTPGGPPHLSMNKEYSDYYYPTIQVRIRNRSYREGMELAQDIMASLHGRAHEEWNSTYYSLIRCSSGPAPLDWDSHDRVIIVLNFEIQRR
ncbi:MAG: minor capsid protein [Bacteroidales bacterium]